MKILILIFILLALICISLVEANQLGINRYKIKDKNLQGIKAVFVGDFHLRPFEQKRLEQIINTINNENPDIVLSVGDFVAGHNLKNTMPIVNIINALKKIQAKAGFYTVLGNHDVMADDIYITKMFNENGINVLANSNTQISIKEKTIYIAGVEDLKTQNPNIQLALINTNSPTILLSHSPDVFPDVPDKVNLTLAGHVHGGQIRLPFLGAVIIPSKYGNRFSRGFIEENNKKMIVTQGIGTSILPLRFLCPPEIVVIEWE